MEIHDIGFFTAALHAVAWFSQLRPRLFKMQTYRISGQPRFLYLTRFPLARVIFSLKLSQASMLRQAP